MSRRIVVLLVLGAAVLSSLTTWIASAQITSPAEVAARTAAPEPSPILVPVERRVLVTKVVTRGTAQYSSPRPLSIAPSALKSGPQIVTTLPRIGAILNEADALLTISGRPTFVLEGAQPAYRDLGPGMSGKDVAQLEQALKRSGFDPGRVDRLYDQGTERAVAALYRSHGYAPMVADEAQLSESRPMEAELIDGARAGPGIQLPASEVVFVPATPLRVTERTGELGAEPDGPLVTVTDLVVVVDGLLPVEQAKLVKVGDDVDLDEAALGIRAKGTVSRVAEGPGTNGADGFHVFFSVVVKQPPRNLVGSSVRITVPIRSMKGDALIVPVSALSLSPDGGSRVQLSVDGKTSYVPVDPGLSADGFVAVVPRDGSLREGDLVVVGFETREQAGG